MGMLEAQRRVYSQCFSADRLGEPIKYNDKDINALAEVGASLSRTDWNNAATTIEEARLADMATFSVLETDVPNPQEGDTIIYHDESYTVARVANYDYAGNNFVLDAIKNGRGFGR